MLAATLAAPPVESPPANPLAASGQSKIGRHFVSDAAVGCRRQVTPQQNRYL
jgi:hypothetical protein